MAEISREWRGRSCWQCFFPALFPWLLVFWSFWSFVAETMSLLGGSGGSVAAGMDTVVGAVSWTSAPWLPVILEFRFDDPGGSSQASVSMPKTSRTLLSFNISLSHLKPGISNTYTQDQVCLQYFNCMTSSRCLDFNEFPAFLTAKKKSLPNVNWV